jgi:hypothetical protein
MDGVATQPGQTVEEEVGGDPLAGLSFYFKGYGLPANAYQDFSKTTPADTDGDSIQKWEDPDTTSVDLEHATNMPILTDVSGSWAARFNGFNSHWVWDGSVTPLFLSGDFSIFVRQKTTGDCVFAGGVNINHQLIRIGPGGGTSISSYNGTTDYVSTITTPRTEISNIGVTRSGTTLKHWENGALVGTHTVSGTLQFGVFGFLYVGNTVYHPVNGDVYALLLATHDMSGDVAQINDALNLL